MNEHLKETFFKHYGLLNRGNVAPFSIEFYPYRNLNHTIRVRDGKILVRISDILADAPREILASVVVILLYKLFRKPPPRSYRHEYRAYITKEQVREKTRAVRRLRGRKHLGSPSGCVFDLRAIFKQLNDQYFEGRLKVRTLSWSRRNSRRILGHYDAAHEAIVISRRLDSPQIPKYVIEFVFYHEMLHAFFGDHAENGRRQVHYQIFRKAEKKFTQYELAKKYYRNHLE